MKFIKYLILVFLGGLIIFFAIGAYGFWDMRSKEPPSIEDAPWGIQTYSQDGMMIPSRFYFAEEVRITRGQPVMNKYWIYDGKRYKKQNEEKTLPANSRIMRRR